MWDLTLGNVKDEPRGIPPRCARATCCFSLHLFGKVSGMSCNMAEVRSQPGLALALCRGMNGLAANLLCEGEPSRVGVMFLGLRTVASDNPKPRRLPA